MLTAADLEELEKILEDSGVDATGFPDYRILITTFPVFIPVST
jgi:hypothetical protein